MTEENNQNKNGLPKAISESQFTLFGVTLKCYVLDNGQRIIDADDMAKLLEAMEAPTTIDQHAGATEELSKFALWRTGHDPK